MDAMISRRCDYGSIFDPKVQLALGIKLLAVTPFVPYQINDYLVTGVPANHGSAQQGCLLFKIEAKDKCLFYGTDTSIINDEVWDHLKATKTKIDLVILDLTYGIGYASKPGDHLGAKDFIDHVQRFKACGLLKKKGEIYATHLSHEGALEHGEFECYARKYDFHIAFDGLTLKI